MNRHLKLGQISGIPILLHWSMVLIVAWVLWGSWQGGLNFNILKIKWFGLWVILVFLSVFLHELGHAIMAKRRGINTNKIVLYPLGGGAFLERNPVKSSDEILIAFAGPAMNLLLVALIAPLIWLFPETGRLEILMTFVETAPQQAYRLTSLLDYGIVIFFVLNLILSVFNLIPAYPLDGGRVLRAMFQKMLPRRQATITAAWIGLCFSILFIVAALWLGDWFFGIGATFIAVLAIAEIRHQNQLLKLEGLKVTDYCHGDYRTLYMYPDMAWQEIYHQLLPIKNKIPVLILDQWQQPYTVITTDDAIPKKTTEKILFSEMLPTPDWEGFYEDEDLTRVFDVLNQFKHPGFPVVNRHGQVTGLLSRNKLERLLETL